MKCSYYSVASPNLMRKRKLLIVPLLLIGAGVFAAPKVSEPMAPELRELSKNGIDAVYAVDIETARAKAVEFYQEAKV